MGMNMRYLIKGEVAERSVLPTGSDQAWLNTYRARDGKYLALSCLEPPFWGNLCRLVGREDFTSDQFSPIERQKEMYEALCDIFATKDRDEWMGLLDEADVAGAPVYNVEEVMSDPHVVHHGLVVEVDHPKIGKVKLLNSPFRLSDTPARPRTRPPLYGEQTREVLTEVIGASEQEITSLSLDGVIE